MAPGAPNRSEDESQLALRLDARFRRPLMSYFLRRVRDHAEAEDLTQHVFLRLLAGRGGLGEIDHAESFVFTVAANLLRDRSRRAFRHLEQPLDTINLDLVNEVVADAIEARSPERVLLGRESLADALKALDRLGDKTRDIFILHRLENLKHREIAELYGLSASSVEKHVIKATLFLARRYGGRP